MARKSFLLLSFVLSVAMVAPAQQGGGGRGGGGGGNTGGNTRPGGQGGNQPGGCGNQNDPFGQQNDPFGQQRQQQQRRPIYLSGHVLLDDGNPPSEPVTIQRICNGQNVPETYTDHKGRFSSITRSKPTAFQAVSFKQFWMRMGGWKNIGEERIRSRTSNITSYGSRSTATRCYGAGWQSGCGI